MNSILKPRREESPGGRLGTWSGVFTPSLLTILGIILFMRLGFVLGSTGLATLLAVMAVSATLALLTSFSLSAISTNMRVKGGGVYYLISRSLGGEYGGALGVLLYFAQSLSIAFYCIGFGEVLAALLKSRPDTIVQFLDATPLGLERILALSAALILFGFAWIGVDWATRLQFAIMAVLALALFSFAQGSLPVWSWQTVVGNWKPTGETMSFWVAFALFFPAVTGFTQGANMSGDLKNPEKSLPLGVLSAVGVSLLVYVATALLLAGALPASHLAADYASMKHLANWSWSIDAGVIAAALSSALASFLGAPRILQSLARDRIFPPLKVFAEPGVHNPRRGTLLSAVIAVITIGLGSLNVVAPVVSMFFLISYGLLNYATYIEAHGASPFFRPRFRWFHAHASLLGALGCLAVMLAIDPLAGAVAMAILFGIQQYLRYKSGPARWADGRRSFYFQGVRNALLKMTSAPEHARDWRPRLLTFSSNRSKRESLLRFASWIEADTGLNTAVRILEGDPEELVEDRTRAEAELRADIEQFGNQAFALAVVSPDIKSGTHALLQAYGIGPIRANTALLNWMEHRAESGSQVDERDFGDHLRLAIRLGCNVVALHCSRDELWLLDKIPAKQRRIDVWWWDDAEGRLMLLLAYLITRTQEWNGATIRLLAPRLKKGTEKTREAVQNMLRDSRIEAECEVVVEANADLVVEKSGDASLLFLPLRMQGKQPTDPFGDRPGELLMRLNNVVLVRAAEDIELDAQPEDGEEYRITAALDRAVDALEEAARAQKEALRAEHEAEQKLRSLPLGNSQEAKQRIELEAQEASQSADKLQREARKAMLVARTAAESARQLCEHSPRALRDRANELALQAAGVEFEFDEPDEP